MNENHIEIMKQNKDWFVKGILFLVLMIISVSVALLPFLMDGIEAISTTFYVIGGIAFAIFTALYVYNLYSQCKPKVALSLNAHGFSDYINIGENVEVEWTNISSVKILGQEDMPFLGISFEDTDIVLAKMKPRLANEIRENIEENLPPLLISQTDVKTPIRELKDMFSRFVREARALQNDTPKKPKNNPFSTEDVLRTFGHFPSDETVDGTATREFDIEKIESIPKETKEIANENIEFNQDTEISTANTKDNNSFFDLLLNQASANIKPSASTEENDSTDSIADEINQLLSKPKSSRIEELEKMLNGSEINDVVESNTTEDVDNSDSDIIIETPTVVNNDTIEERVEIKISSFEEEKNDREDENFEITLEAMIANSFKNSEENKPKIKTNASDLETLVNELDKKVQKKKKSFILQQKDE